MSHPQPWDLGGTLSGQPSLYSHALTVGRQQSGQPRHRRLPQKAPQPSRRANRSKNTAARIAAIAARLTNSDADRPAASVLDKQLRRIVWRDHERALEATLRRRFLPSDRMRQLGRWFATHGEHPNAVRFGILLLGMAGTDGDSDVLKLGAFWAFSTEACEALVRSQADPHRALFELARQAEGWARVDAVGRLEGASDPEIREWLIRESCTGDVLDSYFALTAARVGDLAGVLARKALNEETLDGAGRLLEALTDVDGPGPALASYEDAVRALNGYLFHSTARGITVRRLLSLLSINRFLNDSRVSTICRDNHEWRRMRYRFTRLVADPASRKVVLVGLTDEEPSTLRLAAWAAKLMNIPARPALLRRVESEPYDSTVWFLLIDDCPSEDISAVVEAAARLLPLQELRTGPTTELGLGTEYEVDQILDIIVSRLDDHPGHGWELIETALNNRTSRNRRMALQALKGWPTKFVPSTARQILLAAAAREPVPEVTKEMTQEARRL